MLTALSVAHECGMVCQSDRIVLVEASVAPGRFTLPQIQFSYEDSVGVKEKKLSLEMVILGVGKISMIDQNFSTHYLPKMHMISI